MLTRALIFVSASLFTFAGGSAAQAGTVNITDGYWGGINTYNNSDIIGDYHFDVSGASISRSGPNGATLNITVNTNFAGYAGQQGGTGYGALFLTPGYNVWKPTGVAPYPTDVYKNGEWKYALTIPQLPSASSGTGGLYLTGGGALNTLTPGYGTIVSSNVYGNPITAPNAGNGGWYFRQDQAVQFTPDSGVSPIALASWSVGTSSITFSVTDNGLLGDNFALSWAETCANDVLQGQVNGIPELSTWAMMILGFAGLGFVGYRRSARDFA